MKLLKENIEDVTMRIDKLSYYNTDKVYREYEKRDMPIQAHYNDSMYSLLTMKSNKIFIKRQDKNKYHRMKRKINYSNKRR